MWFVYLLFIIIQKPTIVDYSVVTKDVGTRFLEQNSVVSPHLMHAMISSTVLIIIMISVQEQLCREPLHEFLVCLLSDDFRLMCSYRKYSTNLLFESNRNCVVAIFMSLWSPVRLHCIHPFKLHPTWSFSWTLSSIISQLFLLNW